MDTFLNQYKDKIFKIDEYIQSYFANITAVEQNLCDSLPYAVLNGGKRLRSILCIEIGKAFGANKDMLYPFAMALEFIHAYSLVHDDLPGMDNAKMRRGKPSCHIKYGVGPAILTGDALLNLAYEVMTDECIKHNNKAQLSAMKIIANCAGIHGMINGQAIDLKLADNPNTDKKTFITLIENKTMALIKCAVMSGAYLANCDEQTCKKLEEFAYNLGLAFQIRDDFEDEEEDKASMQDSPNFINVLGRENAKNMLDETSKKAYNIINKFDNTEFLKQFLKYLF